MGISSTVKQERYQRYRKEREAKLASEQTDYAAFVKRLQREEDPQPQRNPGHSPTCAINVFGSARDCDCSKKRGKK
jgi:hypothetical protein